MKQEYHRILQMDVGVTLVNHIVILSGLDALKSHSKTYRLRWKWTGTRDCKKHWIDTSTIITIYIFPDCTSMNFEVPLVFMKFKFL